MAKRGPKQLPRAERFWSRVDQSDPTGCWPWTGVVGVRAPYGVFYDDDGRNKRAHRIAYELTHGVELATDQVVRHSCDNPPCCNPAHLLSGSQAQNLQDMVERGRHKLAPVERGQERYNATLTDDLVREARARRVSGRSVGALAREAGVGEEALRAAARGDTWKHVQ